ncbi:MAG TPA: nucleotidyl transferase AbiEii/AbiGii toxin family protein, partial [Terriglobales bacterium]|nr:nucleotidyl transferase AbiEii/AbiGii toxin family protein [Terriglobales bacterium]
MARSRNEDFGLILVKYGLERILYRLSRSKHRDTFVLKGALLFELWIKHTYRATRDADFLAHGDNSPERFVGIFKELCVIEVEPMVKLGIANSRMKDFYDLEVLSRNLDFDGKMLGEAIRKTFERRGTELPAGGTPVAFTSEFYNDTNK